MSTLPTTSPNKPLNGLARLRQAWGNSMRGLRQAYEGERAFRQEVALAAAWMALALCAMVWGSALWARFEA